jgi:hypothetical protein
MPSVQLSPETYARLKAFADNEGCSPDAAAERILDANVEVLATNDDALRRFEALRESVLAKLPAGMTDDEVSAEIEAARQEVRAERQRAGRH